MSRESRTEKSCNRIEKRTAYITDDIEWLPNKDEREGIRCIGAVHTEFEVKGVKTEEWHYYIASRKLTAGELLHHARMERSASKRAISKIMFDCLLAPSCIFNIFEN